MQNKKDEHPSITFLKPLYRYCDEGFIELRLISRTGHVLQKFISLSEINSVPSILEANKDRNCYFGVATRRDGDGSKNGIIQIPAFRVDLDIYKLTDDQKKESRQRYKDFPFKATFIIDSGGGRYCFWTLKEHASQEDILKVENILDRIACYFHGDMAATDASHILRVPGGLNHKYPHTPQVKVIESRPQTQYSIEDFDSLLPVIEETTDGEKSYSQGDNERLNQMMACEFLKHCDKDRAILSEPEWYGMISILAKETGGPNLIHSLSKGYPKYSPQETDKKILHALNDSGPATCERIKRELFDCGKDCVVKSPASLAYQKPSEERPQHHFNLIPAQSLISSDEPETEWLWEGILTDGGLGLVVAKPKVGKTTLSLNLAVQVSLGGIFLGRKTQKGPVVYLALEEKRGEVQKSLLKLNMATENLFFHFGPAPLEAVKEVEPLIRQTKAKLLVVDILQKFCRVKDLNDYSQVTRALEPLMTTARQLNCHILLVHHAGKRDREDGDDILGSTGLLGGVDTSIHIKKREKRRTFFTIQRYGTDISETVLTLKSDGSLEATGSREEVEVDETIPVILEALEQGPQTINEIWNGVERRHDLVTKALHGLLERGEIKRTGSGKKGDPFRYEKNSIIPSPVYMGEAGKEFKNGDNREESLKNFLPRDFQKNGEVGEGMGKEFSSPKEGEKDLTKESVFEVMDDGQLTY